VNLEDIHAEYDNLLRIAASIDEGYSSATYLLEHLGSAARGSRLHHAGTQLGQLWRAVYLCDYSAQPAFRRTINRLLVRGESVHRLQRAIHYGPIRAHRGRRRDELSLMSGALTLLTNSVIAYNTWKLNEVIEARRLAGRGPPSAEILAHIAPIAFGHINFRGVSLPARALRGSPGSLDSGTPESGGCLTDLSTGNRYFWPECVTTPGIGRLRRSGG
jgi:hypothetical protein